MTPSIINLLAAPAGGLPATAGDRAATSSPAGADVFGVVLSSRLRPSAPAAAKTAPAGSGASAAAIEARIAALVKAGSSDREIAATLAAELAASTAQALGTSDADAHARLQSVFANALAPPGDGAAATSAADRIRALTQRFLKVQALAAHIIDGQSHGQQQRIAGHLLDASSAKEHPAQTATDRDPAAAAVTFPDAGPAPAAALPASPAGAPATEHASDERTSLPALAQAAEVEAPTPSGDGRRVNLAGMTPLSTGGDTTLGRVLTRAALADAARQAVAAPVAAPVANATEPVATPVTAFLKSFAAALEAQADPAAHAAADAAPAAVTPIPAVAHDAGAAPATAFIPAPAPFNADMRTPNPAAATSASSTVDQSAIVDQVVRGAFMRVTGVSSEMRLTLVPETLGDVNVQLVVTAGDVAAHVVAQTPEVRDALVAAQPQLTKALADAGLKLQSFTVDLSGNGFAGFSGNGGQPGRPDGGRTHRGAPSDDDAGDALDAIPSFAPPNFAAAGAGDYDYFA